jgi:hypothetical protein
MKTATARALELSIEHDLPGRLAAIYIMASVTGDRQNDWAAEIVLNGDLHPRQIAGALLEAMELHRQILADLVGRPLRLALRIEAQPIPIPRRIGRVLRPCQPPEAPPAA